MRWRRLLPSLVLALLLAGCAEHETAAERPREAPFEPALVALQSWDAGRARAWASADVAALQALYTAGSAAGERDASMLLRWRERGLRVEDMQTQLLATQVVAQTADRLVLVVTDRLASAVAVGRGPRALLPADQPTTRRVTFRRVGARWLVASVLLVPAQP